MDDDLEPREAARIHRRDRDAEAEARALMRPGMGKVFKQIQDAQRRAAAAIETPDASPTRPAPDASSNRPTRATPATRPTAAIPQEPPKTRPRRLRP